MDTGQNEGEFTLFRTKETKQPMLNIAVYPYLNDIIFYLLCMRLTPLTCAANF